MSAFCALLGRIARSSMIRIDIMPEKKHGDPHR